jgi:spore coat protein CotH
MSVFRFLAVLVALAVVPMMPEGFSRLQAQLPPPVPAAAELFDDSVLHDLRLFINTRDLRQLRERYLESFTVPADFIWRNSRVRNVGLQARGAGSRNPFKLGLDVSFDRYTTGQQFLGLTGLVLDNLWQDPSLLRENLSMSVFRRLGQAAPRESFARVYINNEFQGVYSIVEKIDARFVTAATNETNGRLFEYRWTFPYFGSLLGESFEPYQPLFAARSASTDTPAMLYGPIRDAFSAANDFEAIDWRERLDAYFDLPQLMTHIAIQGCLSDFDGFLGYAGLNNFYLYRHAGTTRHRFFPWDEDFAFIAADASIVRHGDEPVAFVDRALAEPDLREVFLNAAEGCGRSLGDESWLTGEIERLVALVGPAILTDTKKQFSNEAFLAELEFLRSFAVTRPAFVVAEVESLR